jgi:3,4-dihydroxy 2-butanone 4-phosphate synthase/GTP cyclohydrolase II
MLRASMAAIQKEGRGAIVYLRTSAQMDSADLGDLETRLQALRRGDARGGVPDEVVEVGGAGAAKQGAGAGAQATVTQRDFGVGVQILRDLGLTRVRLLTNSTREMPGLEAFGISIVERVAVG